MDTGTPYRAGKTYRPVHRAGGGESMLKAKPHPELAYRAVLGLLALQKKYCQERLTLLVDDELLSRETSRVARLRKNAGLKYQATPEGLRCPSSRGLGLNR